MCPQVEGNVSLDWVGYSPDTEPTVYQEGVSRMMMYVQSMYVL